MMRMKKFINDPENLTPELLEGFAEAHKELVELGDQRMVINRKLPDADRVTIVTQGGSGHEPAISGFVGEGMVDISVVGLSLIHIFWICGANGRVGRKMTELLENTPVELLLTDIGRCV